MINHQRCIAFDLATTTGVAVHDGTAISFDRYKLSSKLCKAKHSPEYIFGDKLLGFKAFLKEAFENKPDAIFYEEVRRFMSSAAAHTFCALRGELLIACRCIGIQPVPYSPTAIKKRATGKGNARKHELLQAMLYKHPKEAAMVKDDNQVDAFWLLKIGLDKAV